MRVPYADTWTQVCTIYRVTRSVSEFMIEEDDRAVLLLDEPCCFYQKNKRVVSADGVVWKQVPRMTVSPLAGESVKPNIDDVVFVEGGFYKITQMQEFTDLDGSYMGTTVDLELTGIEDVSNPDR